MQGWLTRFVFVLSLVTGCLSYKFLVYMPFIGSSHVNFLNKLSETLLDEGHDVTILASMFMSNLTATATKHPNATILLTSQTDGMAELEEFWQKEGAQNMWKSGTSLSMLMMMSKQLKSIMGQCQELIGNRNLIVQLKQKKFDIGFAEVADPCGVGIFEAVGIRKTAITWSVSTIKTHFEMTGAPHVPSYVPGMFSKSNDQMNFVERASNLFAHAFGRLMIRYLMGRYTDMFRENITDTFPHVMDLYKNISLVFLNSEPLIDFPRPTTHKIIDIGGITVANGPKKLNSTWNEILSRRRHNVFLSFGTHTPAYRMPEQYKKTIRETFRKFPEVTFIWKYEKPEDDIGRDIDNIMPVTWAPQNDLLYDVRLSLFITHGGQGSLTEVTTAGVPVVVIPVAGDQFRNAHVLKRAGVGVIVDKEDLSTEGALEEAIREVLYGESYRQAARHIASMIRSRPFSPKDIFLRQMNFLARFGPLRNLDHYGVELNFFQYYCLDVIAAVILLVILILYVTYRLLRLCCSRICCRNRQAKPEYYGVPTAEN